MSGAVEFYNENAATFAVQANDLLKNRYEYDVNWPSIAQLTEYMGGTVLDYGCGAANFTQKLVRADRKVWACDASERLLDIAEQYVTDVRFFNWDGLEPCPLDQKYNLIVAKLVLHYVPDLEEWLENVTPTNNMRGAMLVSVPHPTSTAHKVADAAVPEMIYEDEIGDFGLKTTMVRRSRARYEAAFTKFGYMLEAVAEPISQGSVPKRLNMKFVRQP